MDIHSLDTWGRRALPAPLAERNQVIFPVDGISHDGLMRVGRAGKKTATMIDGSLPGPTEFPHRFVHVIPLMRGNGWGAIHKQPTHGASSASAQRGGTPIPRCWMYPDRIMKQLVKCSL